MPDIGSHVVEAVKFDGIRAGKYCRVYSISFGMSANAV
jgi:hypothetical protein